MRVSKLTSKSASDGGRWRKKRLHHDNCQTNNNGNNTNNSNNISAAGSISNSHNTAPDRGGGLLSVEPSSFGAHHHYGHDDRHRQQLEQQQQHHHRNQQPFKYQYDCSTTSPAATTTTAATAAAAGLSHHHQQQQMDARPCPSGWLVGEEPAATPLSSRAAEKNNENVSNDNNKSHQQQEQQFQQQQQQQQQQENRQERRKSVLKATEVATLVVVYLVTYALYHASIEALSSENNYPHYYSHEEGGGETEAAAAAATTTVTAQAAASFLHGKDGDHGAGIATGGALTTAATTTTTTAVASSAGGSRDSGGIFELERPQQQGAAKIDNFHAGEGGSLAPPLGGSGEFRVVEAGGGGTWGGGGARGVSVVTVSAWQSLAALGVGYLISRFRRRGRRGDARALSDAEKTRRNRCIFVFAAAHLAGTGFEYYGYGAAGPVGAEVLRSTETSFFCLLSLIFGMQRPGLASVPMLLLALGLAFAGTPSLEEFRDGWEGLRVSLAANVLLAVRAIAAKTALDGYGQDDVSTVFSAAKITAGLQLIILLVVEVPRAASGLPPHFLPELWGVGVSLEADHDGVIDAGGEGDTAEGGEGRERARVACLLLGNGLLLYAHVLALVGLLSRLSFTMFAISSGYVRAVLVFALVLSMNGSATGPRSAGMVVASCAVSAHVYRTYIRRRVWAASSSRGTCKEPTGVLLRDGGKGGGNEDPVLPLPRLPLFLREGCPSPKIASNGDDSLSSPDSPEGGGRRPALFVPLLGTRHEEGRGGWRHGDAGPGPEHDGGIGGNCAQSGGDSCAKSSGGVKVVPPSRFEWRWMGLKSTATAATRLTSGSAPQPLGGQLLEQQHEQQQQQQDQQHHYRYDHQQQQQEQKQQRQQKQQQQQQQQQQLRQFEHSQQQQKRQRQQNPRGSGSGDEVGLSGNFRLPLRYPSMDSLPSSLASFSPANSKHASNTSNDNNSDNTNSNNSNCPGGRGICSDGDGGGGGALSSFGPPSTNSAKISTCPSGGPSAPSPPNADRRPPLPQVFSSTMDADLAPSRSNFSRGLVSSALPPQPQPSSHGSRAATAATSASSSTPTRLVSTTTSAAVVLMKIPSPLTGGVTASASSVHGNPVFPASNPASSAPLDGGYYRATEMETPEVFSALGRSDGNGGGGGGGDDIGSFQSSSGRGHTVMHFGDGENERQQVPVNRLRLGMGSRDTDSDGGTGSGSGDGDGNGTSGYFVGGYGGGFGGGVEGERKMGAQVGGEGTERVSPPPSSVDSSFSLNSFELIDKEDAWK